METMPNWLLQRAYLTPHREALRFEGQSWTFKEIHEEALQLASRLHGLGVKPYDRVAILGYSTKELVVLLYACMHVQLEIVLLNHRLAPDELAYQLADSAAQFVFADKRLVTAIMHEHVYTFDAIHEAPPTAFTPAPLWEKDATMTIMYTSGTTGYPKGVRQTVRNHEASALASALNLGVRADDCWLCASPIFHISGFSTLTKSLVYGMTVDLYEKFDAVTAANQIANGHVTHISVVAVMLGRLLDVLEEQGQQAHSRFIVALAGGGPLPERYLQRAARLQLAVSQTYGMTETASQTATLGAEDATRKLGSAGKPLFFNAIRIAGATKPFEEGEICIQGPHVTPGYIGRFAARPATEDGWLASGDIGYIDDEGYLYVVDRRADLIISGGENIYPAEIENVLHGHPAVLEAGVCGVKDDVWGQVPMACVVLKQAVPMEELRAYCLQKLAKYKVPKYFYMVDTLPRNGANKVMRRKLTDYQPHD